jgi:aerobic-type carbon monoxide dehydrogenase small subunit (CoxS/CutS family)
MSAMNRSSRHVIRLRVNGQEYEIEVEARRLLVDAIRVDLGLTGTHIGCEHGVCGNCTVILNGEAVNSCLILAVQADGAEITTIEGLDQQDRLHPLQKAFKKHHALQCGFCTPGMLMNARDLLEKSPNPGREDIKEAISGNMCRCGCYDNIVEAIEEAATELSGENGHLKP